MSADPGQTSSFIPPAPGARASILMVEDNAEVRLMGATLLEEAGFEVHQAGDADEALALVRTGLAFDLLFTDVVMPGDMDGVALAAEVRRLQPGVPVLLTTGWGDRVNGCGGLDLIGKPYRAPELTRKIRALLDDAEGSI
ncbi:MAG: response regulator [Brevundimonas sp.]|uniref:response regulator n=1 Tax=Brevundimonas sp. TaxID=1871086 RepID=UPI002489DC13|nr:response regulator [Brevundimonas sp.]MDI1326415.1 response regulator [Brevundimonas sp.]